MSKKSLVALAFFNVMAIATQIYSIWVIRNFTLDKLKKDYMSFGADLNELTLAALSIFERNWKWLYLMPAMCAILLLTSFFVRRKSGLLIVVLFITTGFLLLMWFALLEPMLRG